MPSLFVTCRRCRCDFPSGLAIMGPLRGVSVFGVRHRCPRCWSEASYFTPEYHLAPGEMPVTDSGGDDPDRPRAASVPRLRPPPVRRSDATGRHPFGSLIGRQVEWA